MKSPLPPWGIVSTGTSPSEHIHLLCCDILHGLSCEDLLQHGSLHGTLELGAQNSVDGEERKKDDLKERPLTKSPKMDEMV